VSDLLCPATFLVLGSAAEQAAARVVGARLAAAYATVDGRAVAAAGGGGWGLGVGTLELDGTTYASALEDLADLHRGETVLVVLPQDTAAALAAACGSPDGEPDRVLEVAVDGDGWSVRSWTSSSPTPNERD
jgi:hypothetical protein